MEKQLESLAETRCSHTLPKKDTSFLLLQNWNLATLMRHGSVLGSFLPRRKLGVVSKAPSFLQMIFVAKAPVFFSVPA